MTHRMLRLGFLLTAVGALFASNLCAQVPKVDFPQASPTATLKQRVGLTDIEITYSRPGVKGRKIFGELEPYGEVWRAGANNATKVTFSTPVKINGTTLAAGSYGLFALLGKNEWQVIFNKIAQQWGAYKYDPKDDVARIAVKPTQLPYNVETFTIEFSDLQDESALLNLSWEKTQVSLKLEVDVVSTVVPQIEAAMAATEGKKPYVGAAMFYLDHHLDLKKALGWMDAAVAEQPKSFPIYYRKAKVLAAMGDKAGAKTTANQAIELAKLDQSPAGAEYVRLSEMLIAGLK
jgi:hypothetical protein